MSASTESMYQEIILDHYRHPQHRGLAEPFDAEIHHVNPTCGDEVTLRVRLAGGISAADGSAGGISAADGSAADTVAEVTWEGEGCSISQASTSIMTDLVAGRSVADALSLQQDFLELMQSRGEVTLGVDALDRLEDAIAFAGVAKYPARVKCALLGWMAMKGAIAQAGERTEGNRTEGNRTEGNRADPKEGTP